MGELLAAGSAVYSELKNIIVWVKTNTGPGQLLPFPARADLCLQERRRARTSTTSNSVSADATDPTYGPMPGVNTFRAGRMDDLAMHPTIKPVALVADAMRDCSRRGDIVLDPFIGSGTTIMAAERVGRRAYGIEIDPRYVDVAVRRWQAYTRRDVVLQGSGQTFEEIAAARSKTGPAP